MVTVEMKGLHVVKSRGKTYVYAWRGGPAVKCDADPGTPEFFAAYQEVITSNAVPNRKAFKSVIIRYRASPQFNALADSTKKNWRPWLDRIEEHFGKIRTAQFGRIEKILPIIRRWRGKWEQNPRTADYGIQVLSRVLAYAVDPLGELNRNPCEGLKQLYGANRSEIIWTPEDLARVKPHCSADIWNAVELAAHTGLRLGDLVKVCWSHVGEDAIIMRTGKSRGKKEAIIPLYPDLRDLLARIPKRSTQILTNSKKRPWHKDSITGLFPEIKTKAWPEGTNLHFNDLRGTAATKFYLAGFTVREIAEMMGWEEGSVDKIIRRYVSLTAALKERIKKLSRGAENG